MHLSLIGMSNVGKTYWSKKLEPLGFTRFGCDDEIEKILGVADLSKWMRFPDTDGYRDREGEYLNAEEQTLQTVLNQLPDGDVVIDTTGSVIYLNPDLLNELKAKTKIVYLQAKEGMVELMIQKFFSNPKPLVWGDHFLPLDGENRDEALRRCYPELLKWRQEQYSQLADLTIP